MNVVLVPGFLSPPQVLEPLRHRLEAAGHLTFGPGFFVTLPTRGRLDRLTERLAEVARRYGPAAVVGHSLGGLFAILAARRDPRNVTCVVGLGTPLAGEVSGLEFPYFELRSLTDGLLPLSGEVVIRRFHTTHVLLPLMPAAQDEVVRLLGKKT